MTHPPWVKFRRTVLGSLGSPGSGLRCFSFRMSDLLGSVVKFAVHVCEPKKGAGSIGNGMDGHTAVDSTAGFIVPSGCKGLVGK
jgi:hypothetical protein